jgi:hypothetical protein
MLKNDKGRLVELKVKGKTKKRILMAAIVAVLAVSGVLFVVWASLIPKTQAFTPHYLAYQGFETRIYALSETSSYSTSNQTYVTSNGHQVPVGSQLFTITLTLRNDYSNDNPPPSQTPVTPIDGTAYVCLNATLYGKEGAVNAVNVTPSDFSVTSNDQVGLVLASGQTSTFNIYLATDRTDISEFLVSLVFVGDSIPN